MEEFTKLYAHALAQNTHNNIWKATQPHTHFISVGSFAPRLSALQRLVPRSSVVLRLRKLIPRSLGDELRHARGVCWGVWPHCGSIVPCSRTEVVSAFVETARRVLGMSGRCLAGRLPVGESLVHAMTGSVLPASLRCGEVDLACVWERHQEAGVAQGILCLCRGAELVSRVQHPPDEWGGLTYLWLEWQYEHLLEVLARLGGRNAHVLLEYAHSFRGPLAAVSVYSLEHLYLLTLEWFEGQAYTEASHALVSLAAPSLVT